MWVTQANLIGFPLRPLEVEGSLDIFPGDRQTHEVDRRVVESMQRVFDFHIVRYAINSVCLLQVPEVEDVILTNEGDEIEIDIHVQRMELWVVRGSDG